MNGLSNYYNYYSSYSSASRGTSIGGWQLIVGLILALAATILLYVFIFPKKKENTLNSFFKFVRDFFNLTYLVIEKVAKFVYVLATLASICTGFFLLFGNTFLAGFLMMILGPIVLRLSYELFMLIILLVKNVMDINGKIKGTGKNNLSQFDFELPAAQPRAAAPAAPAAPVAPAPAPQAPAAPAGKVCPTCGKTLSDDAVFCNICGTKL